MSNWQNHADAASVDVTAARLSLNEAKALEHLRDALTNVEKAIEELEEIVEPEDDPED